MRSICESLVMQFGGDVVRGAKSCATHWVYYIKENNVTGPAHIPKVHFTFITESLFAVGRRDENKFLIQQEPPQRT